MAPNTVRKMVSVAGFLAQATLQAYPDDDGARVIVLVRQKKPQDAHGAGCDAAADTIAKRGGCEISTRQGGESISSLSGGVCGANNVMPWS